MLTQRLSSSNSIPSAFTSINSLERLHYLDHEIRFYIHLLKNGLNHGYHPRRSLFYRLLNQLQAMQDEKMVRLHIYADQSETPSDLQEEVNQLTYELRHLKAQLFPMAGDLISLVIW